MFFLEYSFSGGKYSIDTSPLPINPIISLTIKNGAFDIFYVTKDINKSYSNNIEDIWDYNTVLLAHFRNSLFAGNSNYTVENTDALRIKRRKKGTLNWVYLYEKSIETIDDFIFEFFDYTARSNTIYEYGIAPVFGLIEGDIIVSEIKTDFIGLIITEKDEYFKSQIEVKISPQQQNKSSSLITTMGSRYPFVISNGMTNYKNINISAIFIDFDEANCEYNFHDSWQYRNRLNEFLFNGRPKLFKYANGEMWLGTVINGVINEDENGHEELIKTSFSIAEIGDCDNGDDLYLNGFTDVKFI